MGFIAMCPANIFLYFINARIDGWMGEITREELHVVRNGLLLYTLS